MSLTVNIGGDSAGAALVVTGQFGASGSTPNVNFEDNAGTLDLSRAPSVNLGAISGFQTGDVIKIQSLGASDTSTFDATDDKLTISGTTGSETLQLSGSFPGFDLQDRGGVDTITICFMAGTLIATPDGAVPVQDLQRGDLVTTADGSHKSVAWIGRQTVARAFADPVRSWPIRIKAGALAENVPSRDLLISPDHAVLVEGVLIHAGALVNGSSILRETQVPESFVYYHVELDDHSLILAENTPAETFVDNVDRLNFDNWAEHEALYPEGRAVKELPYARAKAHRQVPRNVRNVIVARAHRIVGAPLAASA